jgi:glycosyltransferase involved in cell wall biosynthesis
MQYYTPTMGGSVIAPYNLIKALSKKGHSITVITTDFQFDKEFAHSIPGVEVIPFRCKANAGMFLYSPEMNSWLRERVDDFDLVHAHNYRTYQNLLVRKNCSRADVPYVLQSHGSLPIDLGKKTIKVLYDSMWGRKIIQDASCLVALSESEKTMYTELGGLPSQVEIIPNIVRERHTILPHGSFRNRIGAGDRKLILYLGRISPLKGLVFLLHSYQRLQDRKDILLVIAGPDESGHRKELEAEASKLGLGGSVIIYDNVNDVASAYQDADLLVYPSPYEAFGLVPFEAMLCGTPVIVCANTGCGEIVKREGCGLVVPYGDETAMAEAIEHALTSPDEMKALAAKGHTFVSNELSEEMVVRRFEETYENCIRDG